MLLYLKLCACEASMTIHDLVHKLFIAEAHPDAIGSDGIATEDAYRKDLEYLKKKVLLCY